MARSNTRIKNLTRVETLNDSDVIPIGPSSGDRAKGITFENIKTEIYAGFFIENCKLIVSDSIINQGPSILDTPFQIAFGIAEGTINDPVMLAADGTITINQTGQYNVRVFLNCGGVSATDTAWLFFRFLINGTEATTPLLAKITDPGQTVYVEFERDRSFNAGDIIITQMIRDSQGDNTGSIISEAPVLGDWIDSPSAILVITELIIIET